MFHRKRNGMSTFSMQNDYPMPADKQAIGRGLIPYKEITIRFLQQEFTCSMMGQPCSGIGPTGYDNSRKKYVSTWIDSMGTGIFLMEGTASADGKTTTLKGWHDEPGGGDMTHRAIWKLIDDNAQILEMYGAHKGDKEVKAMEIIYTRKQSLGG